MTAELADRTAILWDFDGVLYSYHTVDETLLNENFLGANAEGACQLIPSLSLEDAYDIAEQGFIRYHDTVSAFVPYAEEQGLESGAFKRALLAEQLKCTLRNIRKNVPDLIAPCQETTELFEALSDHLSHVMITHAHRDYWARPVAQNLGVEHFFSEIFGYAEFDFQNKGKSSHAVAMGLDHLGVTSDQAIFVEDQPRHLAKAKQDYPDLFTVFIEGPEPVDLPEYVDLMVPRPKDFLKLMVEQTNKEAA